MSVLAAMGERESRRIGEPARRAMDHLRDHGERAHGAGADSGHQQQLGKIFRPGLGRRGERAVQPAQDDIVRPDVVMVRKHQVGQNWLDRRGPGGRRAGDRGRLARQPVGAELG